MPKYLNKYLDGLAKKDYLPKDDLLKIIRKYHRSKNQEEKIKLRDIVIMNNLRLVMRVCYGVIARQVGNFDDMFQNGILGLIIALDRFKSRKGFAFSTYAMPWIFKYVKDSINSEDLIDIKRSLDGAPKSLLYKRLLMKSNGDHDGFNKLLKSNGISSKAQNHIEEVFKIKHQSSYVDLNAFVIGKQGERHRMRYYDVMEDSKNVSPDAFMSDEANLHKGINKCLTSIERFVIKSLYFDGMSMRQAGAVMKLSNMTVAKIKQRSFSKLIRYFKSDDEFRQIHKADPQAIRAMVDKLKGVGDGCNQTKTTKSR